MALRKQRRNSCRSMSCWHWTRCPGWDRFRLPRTHARHAVGNQPPDRQPRTEASCHPPRAQGSRRGADRRRHGVRASRAPGLDELGSATEALRRGENEVVRIATAAAIGAAWLLPVLKRRSVEMPSAARIELLTVATSDELPSDRWDILVHYGRSPRRGSHRRVLFTDRLVAVCAPRDDASKRSKNTEDRVETPTLRLSQLGRPNAISGWARRVGRGDS